MSHRCGKPSIHYCCSVVCIVPVDQSSHNTSPQPEVHMHCILPLIEDRGEEETWDSTYWGLVNNLECKLSPCSVSYRLLLQNGLLNICTNHLFRPFYYAIAVAIGWYPAWRSLKSSFVMVKSNLDDFAGPEQSFFAERFANSLVYRTE